MANETLEYEIANKDGDYCTSFGFVLPLTPNVYTWGPVARET